MRLLLIVFLFFGIFQESYSKNLFNFYNTVAVGINLNAVRIDTNNKFCNNSIDSLKDKQNHYSLTFSLDNNFLYGNNYYAFGTEHEIYFANKNKICAVNIVDNKIETVNFDFNKKHSHGLFFKLGKKINEKIIFYSIFKTKINFVDVQLCSLSKVIGLSMYKKNLDITKNFNYINYGLGLGFSYKLKDNLLISTDYLYNFAKKIMVIEASKTLNTWNHSASSRLKIKSNHTLGVKIHYAF